MILYRIQCKASKQFFCGFRWVQQVEYWNDSGAFFRTPEIIRMHLMRLAGANVIRSSMHGRSFIATATPKQLKNLEKYRVMITDVTVKKQRRLEAYNFVSE